MKSHHVHFMMLAWIAAGVASCGLAPNVGDELSGDGTGYVLAPLDAQALINEQDRIDREWQGVYERVPDSGEAHGVEEELLLNSIEKMYADRYSVSGVRASATTPQDRLCSRTLAAAEAASQLDPTSELTAFQQKNVRLCRAYKSRYSQTSASAYGRPQGSDNRGGSSSSVSSGADLNSSKLAASAYGPPEGVGRATSDSSEGRGQRETTKGVDDTASEASSE